MVDLDRQEAHTDMQSAGLTPADAQVVLQADTANAAKPNKALVEKVAEGRGLTPTERDDLEGTIANAQVVQLTASIAETSTKFAPGKHQHKRTREKDLAVASRRQLIMEYRSQHPPIQIRDIAKRLGISPATVMKDIAALRIRHSQFMEGMDGMEIIGRTLDQYDMLAGKQQALAESYTSPKAKAAMLKNVQSCLEAKANLMADVGLIRRAPARIDNRHANADGSPLSNLPMAQVLNGPTVTPREKARMIRENSAVQSSASA